MSPLEHDSKIRLPYSKHDCMIAARAVLNGASGLSESCFDEAAGLMTYNGRRRIFSRRDCASIGFYPQDNQTEIAIISCPDSIIISGQNIHDAAHQGQSAAGRLLLAIIRELHKNATMSEDESIYTQIAKLWEMRDKDIISNEELEKQKSDLMSKI